MKHQKVTKKRDRMIKIMDKYAQLKKFCHEWKLQVYMYAFMYVDPYANPLEDHFATTNTFVDN